MKRRADKCNANGNPEDSTRHPDRHLIDERQ
jgi:hypothetical protein